LSRPRFLATPAAGAAAGLSARRAFAADTTINFVVWNYSLETIQDNIGKFEAANPGVKVGLTDYTWPDYFDTMMLRFRGNTPTHVMYCGEDWLPGWALANWVVPIEDHFPEIAAYKDKVAPYALGDMTYNGKLYGLPYYADLITFQYNKKILEDNKIAVPTNWDEVLDACLKLKKDAGLDKPICYEYNQELPNFYQAFVSQVYGRGGQMFDDQLNPLFNDPNSEAFKHLQWLQDAVKKHDLIAMENHESKVIPAMNTGKHAFSVLYNYVLAAMNEKATQPLAGQFAMALMPGAKHGCLGFAKFYSMTAQGAEEATRNASWKFIEFMGGGDYQIAKRWAVEKGLGFAQLPLFDDPDVQKAWSSWIDVDLFKQQAKLAANGTQTEWLGMWSGFFRPLLGKAFVGETSVAEAMDAGAQRWLELRKLVRGT
jgi:multiple sugar transport system substrate-binding protein